MNYFIISIKIFIGTHWMQLIKCIIAIGLIIYLFTSGHIDFNILLNSGKYPKYLLTGFFCVIGAMIMPIIRWRILLLVQQLPLTLFESFRLAMIGYFFNIVIPGGAGGDVVRAAYTVKACSGKSAQALTVAIVDRALGIHALLLLGSLAFFIDTKLFCTQHILITWLISIVSLLFIGTLMPLLLIWDRTNSLVLRICGKIVGNVEGWQEAVKLYQTQFRKICIAYLFSILSAFFNILLIHVMLYAVGSDPTITESLIIAPLVILANSLPISPGGIGVGESACAALYLLIGQPNGANGMLLVRLFILFFAIFGLPFYLMPFKHSTEGKEITKE